MLSTTVFDFDKDSSPALVELLWDLVDEQGSLSVADDARHLRGGTLAAVDLSPTPASTERDRTVAALDVRRARRALALAMAAHPAGRARTTRTD